MSTSAILIGLGVTGGLLQAQGQVQQAEVQAGELELDAQFKELAAQQTARQFDFERRILKRDVRDIQGEIAGTAARGGVTLEGTPLALMEQTAGEAERELIALESARDFERFALTTEAQARRRAAFQQQSAAQVGALGTILGTGLGILGATGAFGSSAPSSSSGDITPGQSTFTGGVSPSQLSRIGRIS